MEGAGHRTQWNKKASLYAALIFMWMVFPAFTQDFMNKTCPEGDYISDEGICCNKCSPGFKLVEQCHGVGQRSHCRQCPPRQYMDQLNYSRNCKQCSRCKKHAVEESPCKSDKNTVCQCEDGYYKHEIDSVTYECLPCKQCSADEEVKQTCKKNSNTVCGCKETYYKVNKKCEPCKSCSADCKHLCTSLSTKDQVEHNGLLVNVVAGTAVVFSVALVLGVIITFIVTKRCTKRRLRNLSSQTSESSQDSSQTLIVGEKCLETDNLEPIPQISVVEQEPSKLPDCVPLEIKISDLIYTVLNQVSVKQVRQLVRSLGVTDTEIEQLEMDHRSCREAHYQMLRIWAERGSCPFGGVKGGMLHRPLLEELIEKLRLMHLGQAAEELETKYGIQ
ncbi:tumor necrosis factor receptor superfamily member 1A isoform 1-T4 [Pholidichthys leucotaenia]